MKSCRLHGFVLAGVASSIVAGGGGGALLVPAAGCESTISGCLRRDGPSRAGGRTAAVGIVGLVVGSGSSSIVWRTGGRESKPPGVLLCSPLRRESATAWVSTSAVAVMGPGDPVIVRFWNEYECLGIV